MDSTILDHPLRAAWKALVSVSVVLGIAIFTIVALAFSSVDLMQFLLGCTAFFAAMYLARPFSGRVLIGARQAFLSSILVIWVFLMISNAIFTHVQSTSQAAKGNVDPSAFYQALSWILSAAALVLVSWFRPAYLRRLFSGPLKWATWFAIVVVISCPISPKPAYSAALAFKLCVIIVTLHALGEAIDDEAGLIKLYAGLFVAEFVVVTESFVKPFLSGDPFQGDRLGAMVGLSGTCGVLLLLSVFFLCYKKNPWFLAIALFAIFVMMLAGTKGGMVASFVSLMMFFVLLKRPAQAIAASFVFTVILALCIAFTPLGKSLEKYSESDNAGTLTGRTDLWDNTWPTIKSHIVFGSGYRASRFLSEDVAGAFAEAGNMHNSFLEVLYNNGLAGLIPIAMMNLLIVINLKDAILRPRTPTLRYCAVAALALFTHLFVWGLVAVTFGGAPEDRFMSFFAVLLISMAVRGQSDSKYWNKVYGKHCS